jgi:disintegrin and metalloproteinase domain-containing protein 17
VAQAASDLSKNLRYFETLHKSDLSHNIVKRGANPSNHKFNQIREIDFKALGRNFRLILSPKKGLLSPTFKAVELDDDDKEVYVPIDHESFYDGRVFGETQSRAQVHMEDGVITANIETKEDIYHIEPSWRHLPDTDDQTMIAYRESDIKFSWTEPDENNVIPPKVCDFVRENGTAADVEEGEEEEEPVVSDARTKRSSEPFYTSAGEGSLRQTRCPLLLVADYRYLRTLKCSLTCSFYYLRMCW